MRTLLRRILSAITVVVAVTAINTSPASAGPPRSDCPRGYFCVYSEIFSGGKLLLKSAGNWSGMLYDPAWIFNNGYPYPGYDHIQVYWLDHGTPRTRCIHYYPGPGDWEMMFGTSAVLYNVTWRGEC